MKKIVAIVLTFILFLTLTACGFNENTTSNKYNSDNEVKGMDLLEFLKDNISAENTVDEITKVFEKMCETPLEDDLLLLEYGVYDFTGEDLFYYDLVRQYPDGEGGILSASCKPHVLS